jgi:alpha/beta superfamily hydrolase
MRRGMFDPMRQVRALLVPGPVGQIEAVLSEGDPVRATMVLCHPHPQYGGSMHDGVLDTVARVAQRSAMATLKFNFRGVGASDGSFDRGLGEIDDLLAVLTWLRNEHRPNSILLAGYSFGSNVVWQALDRAGDVAQVLLIAPPIGAMHYAERGGLAIPVDVIYGDEDTFVAAAELERWAARAAPGARITPIAGADHFFGAAHEALAQAVERALTETPAAPLQNSATPDT